MVLLAGGRGPPQGPVPTRGTRRHGRAGHNGTRPPARHRHGSHEQRSLPQRVRLCPLLPLHAQRRLQGRASPGRHRGGGGHHHPLPTGPLHRRRVRAAEPHRDLGRQVLLPGAEVRVDEGRAGVRRDVLQAECDTLQSGQDHAAPLQEEGRVSRVSRRPAALGQFHLCQQPGSQSGEWPGGEEQMNGPHRRATRGVINVSFWKPTQFAKQRIKYSAEKWINIPCT